MRKRFTTSSVRDGSDRKRAVLTRNGVSRFSQSQSGMSVRREKIMEQYQAQLGRCPQCPEPLSLDSAVFLTKHFDANTLPPLVHKNCRRKYEREQAKIKAKISKISSEEIHN